MADTQLTLTTAQIDKLADEIRKTQGQGGQETFCQNWDTAKSVLQLLQPILAAVPGIGLFAGPAIAVVISAGDAAKKAVCA